MNSGNLEIAAYGAAARRPQLGKGALSRLFALTVPVAWRATAGRLGHSSCLTLAGFVCDALHVRLRATPVTPGSMPRYELKTKRIIDERPKDFRRVLDR